MAKDYDEEAIYKECYALYPDFVNNVKAKGADDKKILAFLGSIERHLATREDELNEENFDSYMFEAIKYAFNLRKNIDVRDALSAAYPEAVSKALKGIIPEEYMPIYKTVRRILFGTTTPVITLSGTKDDVLIHHLHMPEDAKFFVGFYDAEGTLLHAHINPKEKISCDCTALYAKAFAFKGTSLLPLCENFILTF